MGGAVMGGTKPGYAGKRSDAYYSRKSNSTSYPKSVGTCPDCGKARYRSRSDAKRSGKSLAPDRHSSPYECVDGWWHWGTLPPVVARGRGVRPSNTDYTTAETRVVDMDAVLQRQRERTVPLRPGRKLQ